MRKLYQLEWQGISFSSFAKISPRTIADSSFYSAFYPILFDRYKNYEELDSGWRQTKEEVAEWPVRDFRDGQSVFSIGCGIG